MKGFKVTLDRDSIICIVLALSWGSNRAASVFSVEEDGSRQPRILTPEEELLANEANNKVAHSIENNLIRVLAAISSGTTGRHARLQNEDNGDPITVTPNPNLLPEVAKIVSAITTGRLKLPNVVNQTYELIPSELSEQVYGIINILNANINSPSFNSNTTVKSDSSPSVFKQLYISKLNKSQVDKLEAGLRHAAKAYDDDVKDPRGIMDNLMKVIGGNNLNSTMGNVQSIFQGANQALQVLDKLGMLDPITDFIQYEIDFLANDFK